MDYRPALAAIPDQKGWRFDNSADYGGLNTFAQGKLDLGKVRRHWGEILRLIATIYTKGMRDLQERRHAVAEKIFHGGALGIVLNCVVRTGV